MLTLTLMGRSAMLVSEHAVCVHSFFLYMVLKVHRNREVYYVTNSVGNGGNGGRHE